MNRPSSANSNLMKNFTKPTISYLKDNKSFISLIITGIGSNFATKELVITVVHLMKPLN